MSSAPPSLSNAHAARRARQNKPALAAGWLGFLTALLFVVHVTHNWVHLAGEIHHDHAHPVAAAVIHDDADHGDHDSDHHRPHPASEHLMQAAAKQQSAFTVLPFLATATSVCLTPPAAPADRTPYESALVPGESPPDPLQPRAPPLA